MKMLTFIDLFCGCGGFSLGLERAGLQCLAAIDFNSEAIAVFQHNFPKVSQALQKDLTQFSPTHLKKLLGTDHVDVIVGGPPCQGFSTARQVDGANHGDRLKEDPRRYLYQEFLKYVESFQPKVFVMENVLGIRSASGGEYFTRVQKEARAIGYRVHAQVEDCVELGLPQKRRRQLFIGTHLDLPDYFRPEINPAPRASDHPSLWEAIGDLPPVKAGEGEETTEYDMERRKAHVERYGRRYLHDVLEVRRAKMLTAHRARPHSERDLRDFALLKEGENSKEAMERGVEFEFPYKKSSFQDRYTRQHRNEPCSTIVAHLSKDGLMFIHPTQNRSLTPREAARIQSFPDWFEFPVARTHQFRVIGNAVPPLVSEAIGRAVNSYLESPMKYSKIIALELSPLPRSEREAIDCLLPLLDLNGRDLRAQSSERFRRAWCAVGFLYPGFHPDGALEHGGEIACPLEMMSPQQFLKHKWVHKDNSPNPEDRVESMMNGINHGWVSTDLIRSYPAGAPAAGWPWSKTDVKPGDIFYVIDGKQLPGKGAKIIPGTKPEAFVVITRKGQGVHEALVTAAIAAGKPVSSDAVDAYGITPAPGYTRKSKVCFRAMSSEKRKKDGKDMTDWIEGIDPRLRAPYYEHSGWPVVLAPVAKEAWRRFKAGELKADEFYCGEAVVAGMVHRCPDLGDGVYKERDRLIRGERAIVA